MTILYFDLETRLRPGTADEALEWARDRTERWDTSVALDKREKEEAVLRLAGTTPEWIEVVGVSYALSGYNEDRPARSAWAGETDEEGRERDELFLLDGLWQLAGAQGLPTLVTFNGGRFDLDVAKVRSAMCGVRPGRDLVDVKPWDLNTHLDLYARRWPQKGRGRMGLKELALRYNLPLPSALRAKLAGAEWSVAEMYAEALATGDFSECRAYGEMDVVLTRELHRFGGGYWWPQALARWGDPEVGHPYDYRTGEWLDGPPPGME